MAVQVTNYNKVNIGRMFARQNVSSVYGAQKAAAELDTGETGQIIDRVTLSSLAPKPLTADFLEQAMQTGRTLGESGEASEESEQRLREDRVFAAVSALVLMGYSGDNAPASWPGGIPAPSKEELEMARRRLAQRPQQLEEAEDGLAVQNDRLDLMQKLARSDFSNLTSLMQTQTVAASA